MTTFLRTLALIGLFLTTSIATASESPRVVIETSQGKITLELFADQSPETVENFLSYVDDGFYNGTIFHRVIKDFMIQGGGFTSDYEKKKTRDPIQNEANNGVSNSRGTIAMARTSHPHSATSQFFINHSDNKALDYSDRNWGYAVFGKVTGGMDVVDAIATTKTGSGGPFTRDAPQEQVVIVSIKRAASGNTQTEKTENK